MIRQTRRALLVCAATATMLLAPAVAQADVIGDWNAIAQAETVLLRPTAHGQSRGIAMVEGAVYDAVNAIDRGYQPYLIDLHAGRRSALGLAGCSRRDRGLPGASGDRRTGPLRRARRGLSRDPGAGSVRPPRAGGHRRGGSRRRRDARRRARVTGSSRRSCPASVSTRATGGRSAGRPRRSSIPTAGSAT